MRKRIQDPRKFNFSDFYCTKCANKSIPIIRIQGKERESGHLKKLYCIHCQHETNMCEIRNGVGQYNLEDFWIEYNYGNFDNDGNRIIPWKQFVADIKNRMEQEEDKNE